MKRVTIRDIAQKAKVHHTTVSRSLSKHPSISKATRERIKEIADKLGYVPDPMLSALNAYRTQSQSRSYQGTIAFLTNNETADGWAKMSKTFQLHADGARAQAREYGYELEEFWLRQPHMTAQRSSDILAARNIRGLILAPQPKPKTRVELNWNRFTSVTFGYTLEWPKLNVISLNTFLDMQNLVLGLRGLGYRRIGLVLSRINDERIKHGWLGGFLVIQHQWPRSECLPVLTPSNEIGLRVLQAWFDKHKPDAIICQNPDIYELMIEHGFDIPGELGFASPTLANFQPEVTGILEDSKEVGATAVDLLISQIHRGEWGIPTSPHSVLVEGIWHQGTTTRHQKGDTR